MDKRETIISNTLFGSVAHPETRAKLGAAVISALAQGGYIVNNHEVVDKLISDNSKADQRHLKTEKDLREVIKELTARIEMLRAEKKEIRDNFEKHLCDRDL